MARRRLDAELVRRGLAVSRHAAQELVARGAVRVGGSVADKPARLVSPAEPVVVDDADRRFVSRGGHKLAAALDTFAVTVAGRRCLDAGASTGGFTDCLLQRGAAAVLAVDVGYGQFDPALRADGRVRCLERTDVRDLRPADLEGPPLDVVVADLSFISLRSVAGALAGELARAGADVVVLVKPQFEAGRTEVSRGRGVVRDPALRRDAIVQAASALVSQGATIMGVMASPLLGPAGNAEFLLHATAHTASRPATPGPPPPALPTAVTAWAEAAVRATPDADAATG